MSQFLRDAYREWLAREGVATASGLGVDLFDVDTPTWDRLGAGAAFVHLDGGSDFVSLCVMELSAGASTAPQRHLYEEVVYVLAGRGSTQIVDDAGTSHTFEWGPKSLFSLPLNAQYRHFNASGQEAARLVSTVSLPLAMKVFRDEGFIFDNPHVFGDRFDDPHRFEGHGELVPGPVSRDMWQTNFVPDLGSFGELTYWEARGAGGSNIIFAMADGTLHAHVSEMPVGTYKKAHRHGPDFHVFAVNGHGYSLFWYEDDEEMSRLDWRHGVVFAPADQMFHQHFNTSPEPARYLATAFGSVRYPVTTTQRFAFENIEKSAAQGGLQIEYDEQDPRVHAMYAEELARYGVEMRMDSILARR